LERSVRTETEAERTERREAVQDEAGRRPLHPDLSALSVLSAFSVPVIDLRDPVVAVTIGESFTRTLASGVTC
jgi:hypothetical protein